MTTCVNFKNQKNKKIWTCGPTKFGASYWPLCYSACKVLIVHSTWVSINVIKETVSYCVKIRRNWAAPVMERCVCLDKYVKFNTAYSDS